LNRNWKKARRALKDIRKPSTKDGGHLSELRTKAVPMFVFFCVLSQELNTLKWIASKDDLPYVVLSSYPEHMLVE
jgi:hypothetical protein